jgi:hypothetical protein
MCPPVRGTLPLGGVYEHLPRGSLSTSEAREQLVVRSVPGTFTRDGEVAMDTHRTVRERVLINRNTLPAPPQEDIVHTHEGEVVWGGNVLDQYRHLLVETASRLWCLLPGQGLEGLPAVFTTAGNPPYAREWLAAFGARSFDLPERGTVRFTQMIVPDPAWRAGSWIAPEIRDIHLHARRGMDVPPTPSHDVLWLSRSRLERNRIPYDEALLEWILGDLVTPVNLETMTLAEQVGMLESSRAIAGAVGGAYYTLLLTVDTPDCLYLTPFADNAEYAMHHRLLSGEATFEPGLDNTMLMRRSRERARKYPGGYRLLVPEALRALESSLLPGLLEDRRLAELARAEPGRGESAGDALEADLDRAAARVLRDPFSLDARAKLGTIFEDRGLTRCALEQYVAIAELSEDSGEAQAMARRAGAIDTDRQGAGN